MKLIINYLKTSKLTLILTLLSVLVFGFTCSGMASHASMHNTGMNSDAAVLVGSEQECCNTGISKTESWKSTLLIVPREMRDKLLLLIIGLALVIVLGRSRFRRDFADRYLLSYRLYARDNPDLILFNHLKLALSRGTLNPKVY